MGVTRLRDTENLSGAGIVSKAVLIPQVIRIIGVLHIRNITMLIGFVLTGKGEQTMPDMEKTIENNMDTNMRLMKKLEEKLIELMGMEEYMRFIVETAREIFREEVEGMADGEFKDYCKEHFDEITK